MRFNLRVLSFVLLLACAPRPESSVSPVATEHPDSQVVPYPTDTLPGPPAPPPALGMVSDPRLASALTEISPQRIRTIVSTLVAFGTRHTLSDTLSLTRGIGAARRWIHRTLSGYASACGGCLIVEYDTATVALTIHPQKPQARLVNVLAWLRGRDSSRVILISGHYDSALWGIDPLDSISDAPGANDDGSGTAAVMELARVFAQHYPEGLNATVLFALFAGEEMGKLGSTHLSEVLHRRGHRIVAAMSDDIVGNVTTKTGYTDSTTVRIFAAEPDTGTSRELGRYVWTLGKLYVPDFHIIPVFRQDRVGRSSDHIPFLRAGDPALRFTERAENTQRQHLPNDDLAHVNVGYIANVARLNGAAIGSLGLAPPAPDSVVATRVEIWGGQPWHLTWSTSPGARSYEVLLRWTTSPTWERAIPLGVRTDYLVSQPLDNAWVGVRAVGADGFRSPVTSATMANPGFRPPKGLLSKPRK